MDGFEVKLGHVEPTHASRPKVWTRNERRQSAKTLNFTACGVVYFIRHANRKTCRHRARTDRRNRSRWRIAYFWRLTRTKPWKNTTDVTESTGENRLFIWKCFYRFENTVNYLFFLISTRVVCRRRVLVFWFYFLFRKRSGRPIRSFRYRLVSLKLLA